MEAIVDMVATVVATTEVKDQPNLLLPRLVNQTRMLNQDMAMAVMAMVVIGDTEVTGMVDTEVIVDTEDMATMIRSVIQAFTNIWMTIIKFYLFSRFQFIRSGWALIISSSLLASVRHHYIVCKSSNGT